MTNQNETGFEYWQESWGFETAGRIVQADIETDERVKDWKLPEKYSLVQLIKNEKSNIEELKHR